MSQQPSREALNFVLDYLIARFILVVTITSFPDFQIVTGDATTGRGGGRIWLYGMCITLKLGMSGNALGPTKILKALGLFAVVS